MRRSTGRGKGQRSYVTPIAELSGRAQGPPLMASAGMRQEFVTSMISGGILSLAYGSWEKPKRSHLQKIMYLLIAHNQVVNNSLFFAAFVLEERLLTWVRRYIGCAVLGVVDGTAMVQVVRLLSVRTAWRLCLVPVSHYSLARSAGCSVPVNARALPGTSLLLKRGAGTLSQNLPLQGVII